MHEFELPSFEIHAIQRGMDIAEVARYLSLAALVALLYDHALTIGDEIRLVWTAPRSFLKWTFLINHYLAEVCLIAIANEMSSFDDPSYNDKKCRTLITITSAFGIFSTLVANVLGFSRVVVLWDKSPRIVLGLSIALIMSVLATVSCTIVTIIALNPAVTYSPIARICYLTISSSLLVAIWASPLAFEIIVLFFSVYSALSRPRDHKTPLVEVLYRDGMLFFVVVALTRGLNIAFALVTEPGLIILPTYFSWAIVTLAIHRLLIHINSLEEDTPCDNDLKEIVVPHQDFRTSARDSAAIELYSYWSS